MQQKVADTVRTSLKRECNRREGGKVCLLVPAARRYNEIIKLIHVTLDDYIQREIPLRLRTTCRLYERDHAHWSLYG